MMTFFNTLKSKIVWQDLHRHHNAVRCSFRASTESKLLQIGHVSIGGGVFYKQSSLDIQTLHIQGWKWIARHASFFQAYCC